MRTAGTSRDRAGPARPCRASRGSSRRESCSDRRIGGRRPWCGRGSGRRWPASRRRLPDVPRRWTTESPPGAPRSCPDSVAGAPVDGGGCRRQGGSGGGRTPFHGHGAVRPRGTGSRAQCERRPERHQREDPGRDAGGHPVREDGAGAGCRRGRCGPVPPRHVRAACSTLPRRPRPPGPGRPEGGALLGPIGGPSRPRGDRRPR